MAETEVEELSTAEESSSLLDSIVAETKLSQADESYGLVKDGIAALISEMLKPENVQEKVNKIIVDRMIAELDKKISAQMDLILHNEEFQSLEAAWRGLYTLVESTDFTQNVKIEILNIQKQELLEDFEDNPDITQSGLYKHVYTVGYGQFGGEPVGAIVADYYFSPSSPDMKLLDKLASVAAMSHAPFISSVGPQFFGIESFEQMPDLKDFNDVMDSPKLAAWRGFRENEDSRYVGLTVPRFLLRTPYDAEDNPIKSFVYDEDVSASHNHYLWGNTAYALAIRLTDSFANYRWCANIVGPKSGGTVTGLPIHTFESMGNLEMKIPTEVLVSDRREYELAEHGFISLTMRKGSNDAAFFSANSTQKPKIFANTPEGKDAETNYRLGTQLPYLFMVTRMAHYIKVIQREYIGAWREKDDLDSELNKWLKQYIADQENPTPEIRSRRPFKSAAVKVEDIAGEPGWYQVSLMLRPHYKFMGANFELSLVGKLEKDA